MERLIIYRSGFHDLKRRARVPREIPRAPREKLPSLHFCPEGPHFVPFVPQKTFLSCVVAFVLCPFCPSHKRLKSAGTVLFLLRSRTVNMTKRVCRDCPIPNCGAKYLVRLSYHLTDVHGLDYINQRKWLQEA